MTTAPYIKDWIMYGLFRAHDTHGVNLADSIMYCRERGIAPGLPAFVADAMLAGWHPGRAFRAIKDALRNCGEHLTDDAKRGLLLVIRDPDRWCSDG